MIETEAPVRLLAPSQSADDCAGLLAWVHASPDREALLATALDAVAAQGERERRERWGIEVGQAAESADVVAGLLRENLELRARVGDLEARLDR